MKLQILSDLHIEFGHFNIPPTDADVLVFAGDIGVGVEGLEWIASQCVDVPAVYVLGNHEYYHHEMGLVEEIKKRAPEHIHVLDKDVAEINGVRFLGCTLWTDFCIFGEQEKDMCVQYAKSSMADFEVIKFNERRFSPEDSIRLHEQQRDWLRTQLAIPFQGNTVVVSHHFPSEESIHPRFRKDLLTPAFGSRLESLLDGEQVALWIHGHTHDAFDYDVSGTRVVCNPRGYVGYESGEEFRPDLVVEV